MKKKKEKKEKKKNMYERKKCLRRRPERQMKGPPLNTDVAYILQTRPPLYARALCLLPFFQRLQSYKQHTWNQISILSSLPPSTTFQQLPEQDEETRGRSNEIVIIFYRNPRYQLRRKAASKNRTKKSINTWFEFEQLIRLLKKRTLEIKHLISSFFPLFTILLFE